MNKKCPQEVVDQIQYWLFEIVFCPGHLYINRYPEIETCGWPKTSPGRPALLSLSKGIQSKYEQRLRTENAFILASAGDLLDGPGRMWGKIDKLKIAFTIRDVGTGWADSIPAPGTYHEYPFRAVKILDFSEEISDLAAMACYSRIRWLGTGHTCNRASMPLAQDPRPCHECQNVQLAKCWIHKLRLFRFPGSKFKLLTVDLTECCSANGYWLGSAVAHEICTIRNKMIAALNYVVAHGLPMIRNTLPDELEVLAPDPQKREEVLTQIFGPLEGA